MATPTPDKVSISAQVPRELRDRIDALAKQNYRNFSSEVRRALSEHLEREEALEKAA